MVTKLTKKGSISKIKVTNDTFPVRRIFRTLKYSNVGRYLDPCQTYCTVFVKKVTGYYYFCRTLLPRSFLDVQQDSKSAYVSINSSYLVKFQLSLGSASDPFRHIRALSKSTLTHSQNLAYRWHIQNPDIFLSQSICRLQGIFIISY